MKSILRSLLFVLLTVFTFTAPASHAQFGKLLGDSGGEKKSSPFGGLLGDEEEVAEESSEDLADAPEEDVFRILTAPEWLVKTLEEQDAYVAELRELYPQEPPVKVSFEEALTMVGSDLLGGSAKKALGGMLGGASSMFGGGEPEPEPDPQIELVQGIDDEQLRTFLALDAESRSKYVLVADQELLVKVFKSAIFEVASGQVKLLRAFDKADAAAALEASASRISGECDEACLETTIKQSKEASEAIGQLASEGVDMTEEGNEQYKAARGDLGAGTFNMAMILPLLSDWAPRAAEELKAATSGLASGMSGMMTAGVSQGLAEATMTEEERAANSDAQQDMANEAEAVMESLGGNVKELLAPGFMVLTKGAPLVKDYFDLFKGVTSYGNAKGLDTSDDEAAEYDFGDM